jgi:hypothetical protein
MVDSENLSEDFKDLFIKMVSHDPSNRLSCEEIMDHPFMKVPMNKDLVREEFL